MGRQNVTTKRRASNRNATKFGIFATILLSGEVMEESKEDYLALLAGLRKTFRPADSLAEVLVEKLAFLYLRLSRVYKSDIQSAPMLFTKVKEALENDEPTVDAEYVGAHKEYRLVVFPKGPSPELLIRYEANIERQIARTLDQLERAQQVGQSAPESAGGIPGTHAH
jgi:hypothetical protein